jgi:hypothetical protein
MTGPVWSSAPPVYERCGGWCGKEYLAPHICRTHALCGQCHEGIPHDAVPVSVSTIVSLDIHGAFLPQILDGLAAEARLQGAGELHGQPKLTVTPVRFDPPADPGGTPAWVEVDPALAVATWVQARWYATGKKEG